MISWSKECNVKILAQMQTEIFRSLQSSNCCAQITETLLLIPN
jgi:hypothetical protein